jgi:5-methylcytosine-specific restriction enzyme subunit McrC
VSITPRAFQPGVFDVSASVVGGMLLDDLQIRIRPRFGITSAMFLIAYSLDPVRWDRLFPHAVGNVVDAVASAFLQHVRTALARGVLQGYRTSQESLATVRGRILFDEQIRRRAGLSLPIEVRYDDYTVDIPENRLVLAALDRLRRVGVSSDAVRRGLREQETALVDVALLQAELLRNIHISFNRLNQRYAPAIYLARLILDSTSIEHGSGQAPGCAFLVRMPRVFEDFVVHALRQALGRHGHHLVQGATGRQLTLGAEGECRLEPDISWWDGPACRFIADVKYKSAPDIRSAEAGDLYQLLAYATSANVPSAMLIHASGQTRTTQVRTRHSGKFLRSIALDLTVSTEHILEQIGRLASTIQMEVSQSTAA